MWSTDNGVSHDFYFFLRGTHTFTIALQTHLFFGSLESTSICLDRQLWHNTLFVFLLGLPACEGAGRFCGLLTGVGVGVGVGDSL